MALLLPLNPHDMNALNGVSQLCGLISFIAILWLAINAFRSRRIAWGLGILFGPVIPVVLYLVYFWNFGPSQYHLYVILALALITPATATFYALQYWVEAKKPFVVYMTSFLLSAGLGYYVFSASGGWPMLRASQDVARGIAQGNLTAADALKFMNSNLDMIESQGLSKEEEKKKAFMREFLKKAEGGFTEDEQGEVQQGFDRLINPSDTSQIRPNDSRMPATNQQLESRQAALKRTPVVQRDQRVDQPKPRPVRQEDTPPEKTLIRFSNSISAGDNSGSDALSQAKGWIRRFVQVTPKQGVPQRGVLVEVSANGVRLEKDMVAGFVTLPFESRNIESIELLK